MHIIYKERRFMKQCTFLHKKTTFSKKKDLKKGWERYPHLTHT